MSSLFEKLGKPFPASDVSWRMQYVDKGKCEGFAVPYLDARAIADRLDEVVGPYNWKDEYGIWHCYTEKSKEQGKDDKIINSQVCKLSVYNNERKEWVEKSDGAENTDFESIKGGLSDAFKRVAVKWNIGRYLYKFEPVWVKAKQRGRAYLVADEEKARLEKIYNETVIKFFGKGTPGDVSTGSQPASFQQNNKTSPQSDTDRDTQSDVYEVKSIRCEGEGETVKSTLVLDKGGKNSTMFMYGKDPNLKTGIKLKNLKGKRGQNAYGQYLILETYDIAA